MQCCNYMHACSFFISNMCSVSHTQNILPLYPSHTHTHSDRHYANLAPLLCHWCAGWAARCSPALFALGPLPHVLTEHPLIVGISPACLDKPGEVEERRNREGGREFSAGARCYMLSTRTECACAYVHVYMCVSMSQDSPAIQWGSSDDITAKMQQKQWDIQWDFICCSGVGSS